MNALERQLVDLGNALDVPATPDLVSAVRGRLVPRQRRLRWLPRLGPRRPVAIGIALAVLLAAGTAAAVPPVRHAVERVFGLDGAVVERVPQLPPLPNGGGPLNLGRRIPLADVTRAVSFKPLRPTRGVNAAYASAEPAGGRITLVIGRSLLTEFRGQTEPFIEKLIGPGTRVRHVRIDGSPGIYLSRAPHAVFFNDAHGEGETDAVRLTGSVLLWQHGPLILRLERAGSLARALALARSLR
jgi:hypothetical protein